MRISDWSSDVCASDLCALFTASFASVPAATLVIWRVRPRSTDPTDTTLVRVASDKAPSATELSAAANASGPSAMLEAPAAMLSVPSAIAWSPVRSEEHTSELQSLMRISYAVFCLKKKNNQTEEI